MPLDRGPPPRPLPVTSRDTVAGDRHPGCDVTVRVRVPGQFLTSPPRPAARSRLSADARSQRPCDAPPREIRHQQHVSMQPRAQRQGSAAAGGE